MNKTLFDFLVIASGLIGYFISISLVINSFYKSRANNYLAFTLFLLSTLTFLSWFDVENIFLAFLGDIILEFLVAVTLFTYFLIQIAHEYLKKRWYKWLYFPFVCSVIIEIILYSDTIFHLYDSVFAGLVFFIKDNFSIIYNLILIFWGRYLVKKSDTISQDKKRWLLRLNFFIICIIAIWFISYIEFYVFDSEYLIDFLSILLSIFLWWILYYGIFRLQIIAQKEEIHQYLVSEKIDTTPIKRKINETTVSNIITQLYVLMNEEELYKNPLLSRLDLATRLGTNEGYLSQIINQETNKSVIQFVNKYRIEAAKNILHNPVFNKYSIEAIGMEAGFKSKSAFYKTFKKNVDMSPGAYRKLQKTS